MKNRDWSKLHLSKYFVWILSAIILGVIFLGLYEVWVDDTFNPATSDNLTYADAMRNITSKIAISIIILWLSIFFPYLAWAVYFYNINEGKTQREWDDIKKDKMIKQSLGVTEASPNENRQNGNPYKEQTFGLPKGTIRGALAITLMVGALAMFIIAIGQPDILRANEFFHENFEFFKTAFLMMIAFYFGSKSLEYLQNRWSSDKGSPDGGSGFGGFYSTRSSSSPSTPSPTSPAGSSSLADSSSSNIAVSSSVPTTAPTVAASAATSVKDALESGFDEDEPVEVASSTPSEPTNPEVESLLISSTQVQERDKKLNDDDIEAVAKQFDVDVPSIKAVVAVESAGSGFLSDDRPKILFEGHKFWKELEKKGTFDLAELASKHPDIVYKKWTKKYYKGGIAEYERFDKAALIDKDSAMMATSWGMFQIMGFNYATCGYNSVGDFVEDMHISELQHLKAFGHFIENNNLVTHLKNHDWASFARGYNGSGYAANKYDVKLEQKYNEYSKQHDDTLSIKIVREPSSDKQTLGALTVVDKESNTSVFECKTLELAWKNNNRNVSCIPTGTYQVKKRYSTKYKNHFHVLNVPNRSWILIHSGNYYTHTLGCILVGKEHIDINSDGNLDVNYSKDTLNKILDIMPDQFELQIS